MSSLAVIRGFDIHEWVASCTPPTVWNAQASTPPVSMPACAMRRRSTTASIRAMICSESAMALLLLAELLAKTNG